MPILTVDDFTELTGIWSDALSDTCILQTRTEGAGSYGYGKPTYTNGSTVACLFEPNRALTDEVTGAQAQITDGAILFNRTTSIVNTMRIKLTKLHGDAVTGLQVYEIIGGPALNHVGQRVKVKLVTDGSES